MAVHVMITVFRDVTLFRVCHHVDKGRRLLRKIGTCQQLYTESPPRRP
jgi:hypothetical protein